MIPDGAMSASVEGLDDDRGMGRWNDLMQEALSKSAPASTNYHARVPGHLTSIPIHFSENPQDFHILGPLNGRGP